LNGPEGPEGPNGPIGNLSDVNITNPLENQILKYSTTQWINVDHEVNYLRVTASTNITKGQGVYIDKITGDGILRVKLALADSNNTMPCIGIANEDINNNNTGLIVTFGLITNLNTNGFSRGDTLYVSTVTAGKFQNSKPTGNTELIQNVGIVTVKNPSTGSILVTGVGRSNDIPNSEVVSGTISSTDTIYIRTGTGTDSFKRITLSDLKISLNALP